MPVAWYVIDVEATGPYPPLWSMTEFAAVKISADGIVGTYASPHIVRLPESREPTEGALRILRANGTPEFILNGERGRNVHFAMEDFKKWINETCKCERPVMVTDNPAFDFQWMNYYFGEFGGGNPFGHSARRVGDLICGLEKDLSKPWKHLRKTPHTHKPLDDAMGVAEAVVAVLRDHNLLRKLGE